MQACTNPDILRIISYILKLLDVVFIILPIGLILIIGIDFFKNVMASKESDMQKNVNIVIKRIIFCVCIFFVPTIVSAVNAILNEINLGVNYTQCLTNANDDYIERRTIEIAEELIEKASSTGELTVALEAEEAISKIKDENKKAELEQRIKVVKQQIRENIKQNNKDEENTYIPSDKTSGTNDGDTSSNELENYGNGTEDKYFAPIQGVTYVRGSFGATSGCNNTYAVTHDISGIAEGTPIYAGIDGKAEFKQTYATINGKKSLTSYGNQVRITASDGTFIIYAHLQKFASGVKTEVTETCPKKGGTPPCPASAYQSTTIISDTINVKKGDLIGYLGNTGNSTGPHLHVEIHEKGSGSCVANPWEAFGME